MADWDADVAIIGAGAAGLMAGIWAGRAARGLRIVALDGAARLGAKILVAGGGRCNVTHERVAPADFAGSTPNAIRQVLRRFDVADTVRFFAELGVKLKREPTGKLFPVTDRARTVLDALLRAAAAAGVTLRHPCRVEAIAAKDGGFIISGAWGRLRTRRAILATGGRSLPKSGSDGAGYRLAEALGHSVADTFPALVPLTLAPDCLLLGLSGISVPARLTVEAAGGKPLAQTTGAALCTHFGLSGPAALDISRHWLAARRRDAGARLVVNWLPEATAAELDQALQSLGRGTAGAWLGARLPERLARTLLNIAGVDPAQTGAQLTRAERQAIARAVTRLPVPVTGDRGFAYAETTAGGVPLRELYLARMASRRCPGLYLCGEICDVDGRIGGFNFQWAWASGYVAGISAARASAEERQPLESAMTR
ncbi:MAG: aminoacetone oxidase family FAD-binding enzyme [Chloracidobacterium sp. CP2_5A]|nr:MAG: aminoacetone oxidase family FAD-binding enzyme [Chloracidobacterium sp. CP2_5A]